MVGHCSSGLALGEREDHIRPAWRDTAEHISNSPLSSDGLLQARAVGEHLKKTEKVTKIYTSPFTRTLQTGNEIAEVLDLPMHVEHGICEWCELSNFMSSYVIKTF